jgi:hypothetical protein
MEASAAGPGRQRRRLRLRYADTCSVCAVALARETTAIWEPATRRVFCLACGEPDTAADVAPIDTGRAGASARREWQRRHDRRAERIRHQHPHIGGLILALSEDPQSTTAWAKGGRGEEELGAVLDGLAGDRCVTLHDRRIPGTRANLDHIVVTPERVFVVDAKRYDGEVRTHRVGSIFDRQTRLYVGRRDRTRLVASSLRQMGTVTQALAHLERPPTVVPVVCFVGARWPLFASPLVIDDVLVVWPRFLRGLILEKCDGEPERVPAVARLLADAFPRA